MNPETRLENWRIVDMPRTEALPSHQVLIGRVTGHHRIPDGHRTLTTQIIEIAPDNSWARTLNTLYVLDKSMPDDEEFDDFIISRIAARIQALNSLPMTPEVERAVRYCAAGKVSWRALRKHGFKSYTQVLGAMADLGLHPYMAPLTGPNVETRIAGMNVLREILTRDGELPDEPDTKGKDEA